MIIYLDKFAVDNLFFFFLQKTMKKKYIVVFMFEERGFWQFVRLFWFCVYEVAFHFF